MLLASVTAVAGAQSDRPRVERPDFSGTWSLDRDISSEVSQATFAPPSESGRPRTGGIGGFGPRGGFGGRGGAGASRNAQKSGQDERLKALADELRAAFSTLVISHHDPSFVVNDAQDHTQFFRTNDVTDENQLASTTLASVTYWEADRLITEYSLNDRRKLVYTYALVPRTMQMVIRVRLETGGRVNGQEVRLVYNLTPSKRG